MDMILKNTFRSVSPAYELIADVTVLSAATTQVNLSGLNIGKDDELLLVADTVFAQTSELRLFFNGNTTLSNYYQQAITAYGGSYASGRSNNARFCGGASPNRNLTFVKIRLSNFGYFNWLSSVSSHYGSSDLRNEKYGGCSTFTGTAINSLNIVAEVANAIGVGSRFQLFKLKAEKVADIILSSGVQSIDITGLKIDKESEYYLSASVLGASSSMDTIELFVNDILTGYYKQRLYGIGTTTGASRDAYTLLLERFTNVGAWSSCIIKLSNTGNLCHQANTIVKIGSNIELVSHYNSLVNTILTSVNKITLKASLAGGLATNSRFTLYRLK